MTREDVCTALAEAFEVLTTTERRNLYRAVITEKLPILCGENAHLFVGYGAA